MNFAALVPKSAWLPITPRGVAAFAAARSARLFLVQFLVALVAAGALGWFLRTAWTPTVRSAIARLPDGAGLTNGVLAWPGERAVLLAESPFLACTVDLDHASRATGTSDLQVELGRRDWQMSSVFGALDLPGLVNTAYPAKCEVSLSRAEVEPWWAAREPFLVALAMAALMVFLFLSWTVLATLYCVVVWLAGFFGNRTLGWGGSWRLAGAALMPGALLLSAALVLYGLRVFSLLQLLLAFGLHFVVGWAYLFVSPMFLARNPEVPPTGGNPFQTKP
jgi:hypothetical protein